MLNQRIQKDTGKWEFFKGYKLKEIWKHMKLLYEKYEFHPLMEKKNKDMQDGFRIA